MPYNLEIFFIFLLEAILILASYSTNTLGCMLLELNSFIFLDLALLRGSFLSLTVGMSDVSVDRLFDFSGMQLYSSNN